MKLASVNIEGDKHLTDRVIPFLQSENPDVFCLQELYEDDILAIKSALSISNVVYLPLCFANDKRWGVGIFSKQPFVSIDADYYYRPAATLQSWDESLVNSDKNDRTARGFVAAQVDAGGPAPLRIITTHFTWSGMAENTPMQKKHLELLLKKLERFSDYAICGDFNIPRGSELWSRLAARLTDNIPSHVTSTVDQNLHKVKGLQLVVDGLFSTHEYQVSDARVVDGVSDHCAVTATIRRP